MFERFTDRARRVVVLAQEEARLLNHNYIGTEHILLGLIREGEGVAAQVLVKLGADLSRVRQQVIQLLSGYSGSGQQGQGAGQQLPARVWAVHAGVIPGRPCSVTRRAMRRRLPPGTLTRSTPTTSVCQWSLPISKTW